MKPFNLKKALAGHPLVTRDGGIGRNFRAHKVGGLFQCDHDDEWLFHGEDGAFPNLPGKDLFLADVAPSKPRPKSETRKNVERIKKIMGRSWMTLEEIETELHRHHGVFLPEQSVSARVRDLRKDEYGGYDIRKKQISKGLYAYKNFGKKGAVK